jgi:hypothetical protein
VAQGRRRAGRDAYGRLPPPARLRQVPGGRDAPGRAGRRTDLEAPDRTDARFTSLWWHWRFFGQTDKPAERVINADPDAWYRLTDEHMGPEAYADVREAIHDPATVHAMLCDYRAGLRGNRAGLRGNRAGLRGNRAGLRGDRAATRRTRPPAGGSRSTVGTTWPRRTPPR